MIRPCNRSSIHLGRLLHPQSRHPRRKTCDRNGQFVCPVDLVGPLYCSEDQEGAYSMASVSSSCSFLGKHHRTECAPPVSCNTKPFIVRPRAHSLSDKIITAKRTVFLHRVDVSPYPFGIRNVKSLDEGRALCDKGALQGGAHREASGQSTDGGSGTVGNSGDDTGLCESERPQYGAGGL